MSKTASYDSILLANKNILEKLSKIDIVKLSSPLSMTYALLYTYLGAAGDSQIELENFFGMKHRKTIFGLKYGSDYMHNLISDMIVLKQLLEKTTSSICKVTNGIFVTDKYDIIPSFLSTVSSMGANISSVNFSNALTITNINKWVSDSTNQLIKKLLSSEDISNDTTAIIINTLYFNGKWVNPFNVMSTKNGLFNGKTASMMFQSFNLCKYYSDSTYEAIELPYTNDYSFGIILPKKKTTIGSDCEYYPLEMDVSKYFDKFKHKKVHVTMPKFKQATKIHYKKHADVLGISGLFKNINLRSMISYPKETIIYIDDIIQEVVVCVDEFGTEAAAATACVTKRESCYSTREDPIVFVADHSFTYYIKYKSEIIMFYANLTEL